LPARITPDFSRPIDSRSGPRYSLWSMSMLVTIAQSLSKALTASSRPPRPTSRMTRSSGVAAKSETIARSVNSKYVSVTSPRARSTASKCGSSSLPSTLAPPIRQRSSKWTRCGFECRPTR
jgi:hypothetical protein